MKKILIATVCLMFVIHSADAYGFRRGYCGPAVYAPAYYHVVRPVICAPVYYGRYYAPVVRYAPRYYGHRYYGRGYYRR